MSIKDLLQDVVEQQEEKRNVIYDCDGILYLSCYKYQESKNIEMMYADFFMRIKSIENELWKSYAIDETILAFTSKSNFRNKLTDKWKADRKPKDEKELNDKQLEAQRVALELKSLVRDTKTLIYKRMSSSPSYRAIFSSIAEADDFCIDYSKKGWLVVAMDSDVIHQSKTPIFNYHSKHWKWIEPNDDKEIFESIITATITGGHNK